MSCEWCKKDTKKKKTMANERIEKLFFVFASICHHFIHKCLYSRATVFPIGQAHVYGFFFFVPSSWSWSWNIDTKHNFYATQDMK